MAGVPIPLPGALTIGVPVPVSPCRLAGDIVCAEAVAICTQHRADLGARGRFEILFGNKCDDVMAYVAPGCALPW
jgi:hypothetical protein